jgi:hypothetical protein
VEAYDEWLAIAASFLRKATKVSTGGGKEI